MDVNSFVDYFILNELSKNIDSYRTSAFFHKDRDDKNKKLVAGPPWDYNLGFGNANYYSGEVVTDWVYQGIPESDGRQIPFWWQRFLSDPVFYSTMKQRYTSLRGSVLKTENIHKLIDSLALVLKEPQARNFAVWKIMGKYVWPNPYYGSTYQQEIDYLKKWIGDRLGWIDSNLLTLNAQELNQVVGHGVVVYPNPFQEQFFIEFFPDGEVNNAKLELYDLAGKKLFQDNIRLNASGTLYSFDGTGLGALSRGVYILKMKFDTGKEFSVKIIRK
jgi:hypothetical protein